jgi:hypothetical protein
LPNITEEIGRKRNIGIEVLLLYCCDFCHFAKLKIGYKNMTAANATAKGITGFILTLMIFMISRQ